MPRAELRDLALVALLALGLRLGMALLWDPEPTGDGLAYIRLAESLARGDGFRGAGGDLTSWRPPLFPALLVPFVSSEEGGIALPAVRVAQALLSTLSVLLLYQVARPLFGRGVATVAGLLTAVGFAHVAAVSRVLSETLCVTFLLSAIALLVSAHGSGAGEDRPASNTEPKGWGPVPYLVAGGLLGAAGLTRSMLAPFPLVVAAALAWRSPTGRRAVDRRSGVASGLLVLTGAALVMAPWAIRNYGVHGTLIAVSTQSGATLYAGNHPRDGTVLGVMADDERTRAAADMAEPEASRYLTQKTVEDLAADPGSVPRLALLKLLYFWTPEDWEVLPRGGGFNYSYAFVALWAAVGLVLPGASGPVGAGESRNGTLTTVGRLGPRGAWMVWLPITYFLAVALVYYGSPRLRMPVEPLLAVFAAWGLCRSRARLGASRTRGALVASGVVVGIAGAAWRPVSLAVKSALAMVGAI